MSYKSPQKCRPGKNQKSVTNSDMLSCRRIAKFFLFSFSLSQKINWRKNSYLTYAELHSDFFLSPRFIQDLFLTRTGDSSSPILSFKKVWKSRFFPGENTFFHNFVDATCDLFTFQMYSTEIISGNSKELKLLKKLNLPIWLNMNTFSVF